MPLCATKKETYVTPQNSEDKTKGVGTLLETVDFSKYEFVNSDTTEDDETVEKKPKMATSKKGSESTPTSRDTRGGTTTKEKEEDDVTDMSSILLGELKGEIRSLKKIDGEDEAPAEEIVVIKKTSHYLEIPNDLLIRSYNALHEKNVRMEETIRNAKKEIVYLRRRLYHLHESSKQPTMDDITNYKSNDDDNSDSV